MREQPISLERVRLESMNHYGFGVQAMKQLKVCKRCGASGKAWQQFCHECGAALSESTLYDAYKERHRSCPICDTVVSERAAYCPQCGTIIKERTREESV